MSECGGSYAANVCLGGVFPSVGATSKREETGTKGEREREKFVCGCWQKFGLLHQTAYPPTSLPYPSALAHFLLDKHALPNDHVTLRRCQIHNNQLEKQS